jgi:hypothetical protein
MSSIRRTFTGPPRIFFGYFNPWEITIKTATTTTRIEKARANSFAGNFVANGVVTNEAMTAALVKTKILLHGTRCQY